MIPQYSWRCGGMRVRAPTDAASEKARDQGEAKRQYATQQMDLPSRTDASNRKHFLCRPAAPLQAPTRRVSKATNGVTPGPLHSRRRVVQGIQPPTLRHREHPHTALPSPPRPQRCPNSPTKAPRPSHPAHGTKHEADPGAKNRNTPKIATFLRLRIAAGVKTWIEALKSGKSDAQRPISASRRTERSPQSQKSCTEVGIFVFAKRIVVTEQFLRKTRVPSMPIKPSSSTEPQRIDHTSTHALTLGKDPALARPKNATSEEKRWAK